MREILSVLLFVLALSCANHTDKISTRVENPVLPVLTGKEANPVLKVEMIRQQPMDYSLQKVVISLDGTTDLNDIERVSLFKSDSDGRFTTDNLIGEVQSPAPIVTFEDNSNITEDTLTFWVSVTLKTNVDLTHRIKAQCKSISTDIGKIPVPSVNAQSLRVGVAVRQHMQDGVHTSRIPGLTTSKKGTLLAIYDARYESARDLQGHMDICMNRSTDGGRTWQPMQVILDMNEWGGLPEKYNGVSDACILVDDNTGDIYVAGLWMHGVLDRETGKWVEGLTQDSARHIHQWHAKGSQPGFGVKETSQFLITKSTDDGLTWSEPINITPAKKKEWWLFAPAPGHGITLSDGTLVFPTQGRDETGEPFSNITWSKDGGKTWTTSNPATKNTTECMAVQLPDGSVMLNMRDNRNRGNEEVNGRSIFITTDLGRTWTEHPTSRKALIEPTCMASIHKHVYHENGVEKSVLLFVNPASTSKRDHITMKVSYDDGNLWPEDKHILLDEYSGRGYSCITSVNDSTIGILYESSQADMVFQTVSLKEIQ
ncbi:MAG: sialidase family protein [Proteiniphilum sp.]|uniref:sialidase family protein n=1 Tax=Proteiniphilum sp. TaxID=1926877 RepID=UPI000927D865|nr:sialidase family protein [Proteiniphilum sp.]MEA5127927.1 sialidase family protein [Proteiniphilum sp.]OJV78473.1 MAG: sialidase [Bacteroidia bacterium 44-10]